MTQTVARVTVPHRRLVVEATEQVRDSARLLLPPL
jgi:hypothetical protein